MKYQILDEIHGMMYSNPEDPKMVTLCDELGIKYKLEPAKELLPKIILVPSEEFVDQLWKKTAVFDKIDKEVRLLKQLLDNQ